MIRKEKWKTFYFDKSYLISSWGRIFSLKRKRLLRPYIHRSNDNYYLRVNVGDKKYMVHVIVAFHFLKVDPKKLLLEPQVNHKDRNTLNCNIVNLEYVTKSENIEHFHATNTVTFRGKSYRLLKEKINNESKPK